MLCLPPPKNPAPVMVPVTALVHPLQVRRHLRNVEVGRSIESVVLEIVPMEFVERIVVTINGEDIATESWPTQYIQPKDVVVFRAIPGQKTGGIKSIERIVLTLVVMVAAIYTGGAALALLGPELGGTIAGGLTLLGSVVYGGVIAGITMIGNLLVNAIIPPSSLSNGGAGAAGTQTFGISGIQNQELPYGVVPRVFGRTLMTPPKAAHSYTVITSDNNYTYLYAYFDLGPGPIAISDIKIGQTPIDDFAEVEYETREGRDSDDPITIFTNAVTQTPLSIAFPTNGTTATQRTPINTEHIELDITFPGGLFDTNGSGNLTSQSMNFNIKVKTTGGSVLQDLDHVMTGTSASSVAATIIMDDQASGQYDVVVTMTSTPPDAQKGTALGYWTSLRTWNDSTNIPLLPQNHAKIAVKIRATEQLNGDIANLNCIAQAYVQVWDGTSFSEQLNTHPAWAAYTVLTGTSNARPLDNSRIDLASLLDWATEYPEAEFNYVVSQRATIWQTLRTIGSAGRALPVIRDGLYGYIFDHVQDTPVQMFTARNVNGFKATTNYFDEVQAMEIRYISETLGWQQHSVYTYADGFTVDNTDSNAISTIQLTGVTSDDWAFKLGSYFFAAGVLRPTVYQFNTDLEHLACNPGDRIWVQHDIIGSGIISGRATSVTHVTDALTSVTLDEGVVGDGTSSYTLIIRTAAGTIYTVPITIAAGETTVYPSTAPFDDSADPVQVGDLVAVATTVVTMLDAIVKTITPQSDFKATVTCLDYAPTVHSGDEADVPPVVNGRIDKFLSAPPTQGATIDLLAFSENDALQTSNGGLQPRIHGHFMPSQVGLIATMWEVQWQLDGDIGWQALPSLSPASRDFYIPITYAGTGSTYNARVRGNNTDGNDPSAWDEASLLITDYVILPPTPTALALTPTIGGCTAAVTPGTGAPTPVLFKIYANTVNTFGTASLLASSPVSPVTVTGLVFPTVYYMWATIVNGAGVESDPSPVQEVICNPVGYGDLAPDVNSFLDFEGNSTRDLQDQISNIAQALTSIGLGAWSDIQEIRTEITATADGLTADYTSLITAATGPSSTIVLDITTLTSALTGYLGSSAVASAVTTLQTQITTDGTNISAAAASITSIQSALSGYTGASAVATAVTSLQTQITTDGTNISAAAASITSIQSALTGYTGASAVSNALSSLSTSISTNAGNISANASAITATSAKVGNVYASGLFRVDTASTPSGADARITLEVAASSGGSPYAAALYLDAMTGGTSRITMIASQIFMTDGTNLHAPFSFSGGVLVVDTAVIQNLNASHLTAGSIVTSNLGSNSATDNLGNTSGVIACVDNTGGATTIASINVTVVNSYSPVIITAYGVIDTTATDGFGGVSIGIGGGSAQTVLIASPTGLSTSMGAVTTFAWNAIWIDLGAVAGSYTYTIDASFQDQTGDSGPPSFTPIYGSRTAQSTSCQMTLLNFKR